uniref:Transmembrane protein n=1 Tax=Lotus japonicus TaxID=34305 RepID=I3SJZ2_LOTJA|nr:unknown [Lotus japonicus]
MLSQMQSPSLHPFKSLKFPIPVITPPSLPNSPSPFSLRVRTSTTPPPPLISEQQTPNSPSTQSRIAAAPPSTNLGFRPTPELGLLSHLFVLSMAFCAFLSVAAVSIPTLIAFGRLRTSVKKLSKVVSEEVPGTLYSLKLSSRELNDLTKQLSDLRHNISGVTMGKKDASSTRSRSFRKKNPAS